ncbi:MAG: class I SAM-dependent methyltransferase [Deltaproteobacteria bacterium]|nr:class I SAM-dependent methyltransferase [Deltaproteobacteria bacterium]
MMRDSTACNIRVETAAKSDTSCNICGSGESRHTVTVEGHNYVRCAVCGVERMAKYPTNAEVREFYSKGYMTNKFNDLGHHIHFTPEYRATYFAEKDLTFSDLRMEMGRYSGKSLLDVGCANGQFLEYAQRHGIRSMGIDISEEMVNAGRKNGLNCEVADLFDLKGSYDLVTFWDVVEHVTDPKAVLEKTMTLLNPGGELVIQTPCTGMVSELFGEKWLYYLPVQHIHLFSQDALFGLLSKTGYSIVSWVRFGSCNPRGSIPDTNKKAIDTIVKRTGIGDTIVVRARRTDD